jgi:hypothetical protein
MCAAVPRRGARRRLSRGVSGGRAPCAVPCGVRTHPRAAARAGRHVARWHALATADPPTAPCAPARLVRARRRAGAPQCAGAPVSAGPCHVRPCHMGTASLSTQRRAATGRLLVVLRRTGRAGKKRAGSSRTNSYQRQQQCLSSQRLSWQQPCGILRSPAPAIYIRRRLYSPASSGRRRQHVVPLKRGCPREGRAAVGHARASCSRRPCKSFVQPSRTGHAAVAPSTFTS